MAQKLQSLQQENTEMRQELTTVNNKFELLKDQVSIDEVRDRNVTKRLKVIRRFFGPAKKTQWPLQTMDAFVQLQKDMKRDPDVK